MNKEFKELLEINQELNDSTDQLIKNIESLIKDFQ